KTDSGRNASPSKQQSGHGRPLREKQTGETLEPQTNERGKNERELSTPIQLQTWIPGEIHCIDWHVSPAGAFGRDAANPTKCPGPGNLWQPPGGRTHYLADLRIASRDRPGGHHYPIQSHHGSGELLVPQR